MLQPGPLETMDIPPTAPSDLAAFWRAALRRCEEVPLNLQLGAGSSPEIRDLTFAGLDGTPVHAWLLLPPAATAQKVPVVIHCHGANRSRGRPEDFAHWLAAGYAVIAPDFRLQGGTTGSVTVFDADGKSGWWVLNLNELLNSYLYHVWTDFLRAVRLARETPEIDPERIAVEGHSQGGGMALGLAALDRSVSLCMADVPSSCWMERRIATRSGGGAGIADYLASFPARKATVLRNLSYFDNLNLAPEILCPVLVSCGLQDTVCPPECTYAAYNKIRSVKEMAVYPNAGHEGGRLVHRQRKLDFAQRFFERKP